MLESHLMEFKSLNFRRTSTVAKVTMAEFLGDDGDGSASDHYLEYQELKKDGKVPE